MANINQTNETMKRIAAKQKLGLPLNEHERAMLILYGEHYNRPNKPEIENPTTVADRAKAAGIDLSKATSVFGEGTKNCIDIEVKIEQYLDHTGFRVKIEGKVEYTDGSVRTVHPSWGDYNITAHFDWRRAQ